jgi:GntR family transcriptional regulator
MRKIKFIVNPNSREDLHLQIQKQIEYRIATGQLIPGDRLPTIRELENELKINRHTVRKAYNELEKKGLLRVQRRQGVKVATGIFERHSSRQNPGVYSLMEKTLGEANKLGIPPLSFVRLLKMRALEKDAVEPSLAFVECSLNQAQDLAQALEVYLGQAVLGIELSNLISNEPPLPESVKYVIAPVFHADDVKKVLKKKDMTVLTALLEISPRFRLQVEKHKPVRNPCIILGEKEFLPWFPNMLKEMLGLKDEIESVSLNAPKSKIDKIIKECDLVLYSPPCKQFVTGYIKSEKASQEILFDFTPKALEHIKQTII